MHVNNAYMEKHQRFIAIYAVLVVSILLPATAFAEPVSYNRDIRPILSDKCFSCHGPDNQHRSADLRLDVTANGENYDGAYLYAIIPGEPDQSALLKRIHSKKKSLVMPPPESALTLTDQDKALLRKWIEQGAKYEKHWAFEKPIKPTIPKTQNKTWPKHAIDAFVLARLEQAGLKPSPEADKAKLLRRLTLDLTGLPPTPAELDAFLNDKSPNAYEKQIDRLLASPRFGERMALPWLDAARYADTNGFSIDDHRDMWLWREWVIDAYNKNMPYDQFLVEQLAGDLIPNASDKQKLATGFLRNSMNTHEGGTIAEEYRVIYIADKIDTVSTVFMGLTMRCAQCHDHKYDPLSIREYYQMYAFFDTADIRGKGATNANTAPLIRTDGQITSPKAWQADMQQRIDTLKRYLIHPPELIEERAAWEKDAITAPDSELSKAIATPVEQRTDAQWKTINETFGKTTELWGRHINTIKREIAVLEADLKAGQASVMVMKEKGPRQTYVLNRGAYDQPDKDQPVGPGVPAILPPLEMAKHDKPAKRVAEMPPWQNARWVWDNAKAAKAEQDNKPRYFRYTFEIDGKPAKAVLRATADNTCTTFINGKKLGTNDPWMTPGVYDVAKHLVKGKNTIAIEAANAGGVAGMLASLMIDGQHEIGSTKDWKVTQSAKGKWTSTEFDDSNWAQAAELGPSTMSPWKIGGDSSSPAPDPSRPTRLDLANWLAQPDHPLTARVAVNRIWQMLFTQGLVTTSNDFGAQGTYPTHPELLDYLATDFVENGWDTKRLIKQILMSATYRQASDVSPELLELDPKNALLARMSRQRLPAEFIRDSALAISGQLDPRVGGPSVYPRQPDGLWREVSHFGYPRAFTAQAFYPSADDGLTRRSMYTFWKRTSPPPSLTAFDAPSREVCTVDRPVTNTPLQALVLLNDPEYLDAARNLAKLTLEQVQAKSEARLAYMFRRATGREPSDAEISVLMRHKEKASTRFKNDPGAAADLVGAEDNTLATWTSVASIILNLDETITRE